MPPRTPVPHQLRGRPFLRSDARRAGLSGQVLRGRRFRQLFRSVYVSAEVTDCLAMRVDAVRLLLSDDAVVSYHTAALLRGLPVPATDRLHLTVRAGGRPARIGGVCVHQGSPAAVARDARPLSAPAENFLELAESLSLVDLVVLGDAMVRRGFVSCAELVEAAASTGRRRGVRLARLAAALVRPLVDSPMETRLRLLIVFAGLPEPVPNLVVQDEEGGWIGAVDLLYAAYRIAIEYHGDVHRSTRGKWRRDVAKAELLARHGWVVIVLTADDLYVWPERTLRRVHEALLAAGHPAAPADLDPAWRQHFSPRWVRDLQDQMTDDVDGSAIR